ncbi:MAG: thymidine kinase [Simkaniaceae bacterium]|nr:thymidine kinase [Simkaniaceae bacterium]MCF7852059.1 thymidine kinase [Simkaniaceae bacterium]
MAKLYFYYSAMNAGKSTTLLQASYNYHERGMQTLLFAPSIDTRFGSTTIYSRIGLKKECFGFTESTNLYEEIAERKEQIPSLRCVLIDEAHFLKKAQIAQLAKVATQLGIAVLCYGLRSDFLGEPFEGSRYLLAWADELSEIKTICHCGRKATMNLRIDENGDPVQEGDQIQIGGNESYTSMCMHHFIENVEVFRNYAIESSFEYTGR